MGDNTTKEDDFKINSTSTDKVKIDYRTYENAAELTYGLRAMFNKYGTRLVDWRVSSLAYNNGVTIVHYLWYIVKENPIKS